MFKPNLNALAAGDIYRRQGRGAWYAPPVPFQTGGMAESPFAPKGRFGRAHMRIAQLPGMRKRIGKLLKRVAKTDERLQIAQTLAGYPTSPGGAELAGTEKTKQLNLLGTLLSQLGDTRQIAKQGFRTSKHFNKNPAFFRDTLTDIQGLTGRGGRLLDTRTAIAELRGTTTAGLGGISIADLLRIRDASQLGLLNNLPTFHGGGTVGGPTGSPQPIMASGGEVVSPAGGNQYFDIYIGGEKIAEHVRAELRGADRHTNIRARAGVLR